MSVFFVKQAKCGINLLHSNQSSEMKQENELFLKWKEKYLFESKK